MTRREFARLLRKVHRARFGELLPLPEQADEVIEEAEAELGFALPEAARYVFALAGPDFVDLPFAIGEYLGRSKTGAPNANDTCWPGMMLPIKDLGTDCWVCLDCKPKNGPVYLFRDGEGDVDWPAKFEMVAPTLVEYLRAFLDAEGEFPGSQTEDSDME
jgi:SMI1 / KNR4 family (SUKH-1)